MKEVVLTMGERFKDARTVHNQHGHQTMAQVHNATGISASMIKELEDDSSRDFGYRKISKLAEHYGVSIDWLLGMSSVRSPDASLKAVVEYTGIPEDAIQTFRECARIKYLFSTEQPNAKIRKAVADGALKENKELNESDLEDIYNSIAQQYASIFDMIVEFMRYSSPEPDDYQWMHLRDMAIAHFKFVCLQKKYSDTSYGYGDPEKYELEHKLFRCQQSYIDYCKQLAKGE